jgi:phytol kinase
MNAQLISLLIFLTIFGALMGIAVLLHRYFKLPAEQSRKFLHVSGGILSIFIPLFFHSHWWVLALTGVAFVILLVTYMRKWLPAVHQINRNSIGSVLFPVPVYLCFLIATLTQNNLYFWLPISLLAISDTAAEIGGQLWGAKTRQFFNGQKTMAGTLSFAVTALLVNTGWLYFGFHLPVRDVLLLTVLITLFSAGAELVTLHGWDNLTVPAIAALIIYLFL